MIVENEATAETVGGERVLNARTREEDLPSLRPSLLSEFVGQDKIKKNLSVFVAAAKSRKEPLDHVLLSGPPGLGKTTLAHIIAKELGVNLRVTTGPSIEKSGDLAAILSHLEPFDVLFVDEIHRIPRMVEEILYPAMEDFKLDLMIGEGPAARSLRIDLPPFTLVGATTRGGLLSSPLRSRFGIPMHLEFYSSEDLAKIVRRSARILNTEIDEDAAVEIAKRSRQTPRIANRLLKRVRDFAETRSAREPAGELSGVTDSNLIDLRIANYALEQLEVDNQGCDPMDRRLLEMIIDQFQGGPVGVETLCASLQEERDTIEDIVEPYLLQAGFISRTPRGRMATEKAYTHLKKTRPAGSVDQKSLFN